MKLSFTKMQGLGNDFVVFDAINQKVQLTPAVCREIADRHFGIGCDQILLIEPPHTVNTDFHYRIFNADGSEVEACGNGARCFALFIREKSLCDKNIISVGTMAGRIILKHQPDGYIEVDMGIPIFKPSCIPFETPQQAKSYSLNVGGDKINLCALSMGNPHAVIIVPDIIQAPVSRLGPLIENNAAFPQKTNVGFMQIVQRSEIHLRVYERGTGETLACGTGASAAVVAGRILGLLDERILVHLPGGDLVVKWHSEGQPVLIQGPAETVYEGTIEL
ncbi:MAG: diaminopimelate epimerase [Candidatus Thiodiazotropha sp.]|nr:diaminopimelate epimerase [Candidatus Thiodiazotropha sp.]MCM8884505.1 diaminopimelate epimerase [Candidatus Thiodiazotropha sp.]MCM8920469.1 diaminopimelate epimerase [Candidatus Thiodiazotropha sp.]